MEEKNTDLMEKDLRPMLVFLGGLAGFAIIVGMGFVFPNWYVEVYGWNLSVPGMFFSVFIIFHVGSLSIVEQIIKQEVNTKHYGIFYMTIGCIASLIVLFRFIVWCISEIMKLLFLKY